MRFTGFKNRSQIPTQRLLTLWWAFAETLFVLQSAVRPGVTVSEVFSCPDIRVPMLAQYLVEHVSSGGSCLVKSLHILASEETLDSLDLLNIFLRSKGQVPWFLEVLLGVPMH